METVTEPFVITAREGTLLYDFQRLQEADIKTEGLKGRALHSALEKVRRRQTQFETALIECHDSYQRKFLREYLCTLAVKQVGDHAIHDLIESLETA